MLELLHRLIRIWDWALGWLPVWMLLAPLLASASEMEALAAVQVMREGGCGGLVPAAAPVHHEVALDTAARQWALGGTPAMAVDTSGYHAARVSGIHLTGTDSGLIPLLRRNHCQGVTDRDLRDLGIHQHGQETWLILAARSTIVPPGNVAPALAQRTLTLVNEVRARGATCGRRSFAPAPPVALSSVLNQVAQGHAADMASHDYFEHQDLNGHTPADRVRAVGYAEKLVGENIAYGPESAEEVVKGWLNSPGHCENMLDPRFAEMGIASAPGRVSRKGLYWVQLLAAPKA